VKRTTTTREYQGGELVSETVEVEEEATPTAELVRFLAGQTIRLYRAAPAA